MPLTLFHQKFLIPEFVIHKTKLWTWSLRPNHCTLGAGVLSLNRHCPVFSELTTEEGAELGSNFRTIETTLKKAFKNDKINYLGLMMVDQHVHYHIIPRYGSPREFAGHVWTDPTWPTGLPDTKNHSEIAASSDTLQQVLAHLKNNLAV
jgi:diadenosine tetraphosphate (Ap4A) HIT family hydrolase